MGVFDGSIYRIRAQWDSEPGWNNPYKVTLYTEDPEDYFLGLGEDKPDHATVHELHYTVRDTDYSFGEYVEDE